jgi:hypothetical protein
MVIGTFAFVPGNEGREAVTISEPGVLLAVNMALKFPDPSVVVEGGVTIPRLGLFTEKFTATPPAGLPFIKT